MNGKSNLVSPALALTPTNWSDQKKEPRLNQIRLNTR